MSPRSETRHPGVIAVHGGSTWNSAVNREQLNDGVAIMTQLVPLIIDLLMQHPDEDWGKPIYPVVEDVTTARGTSARSA